MFALLAAASHAVGIEGTRRRLLIWQAERPDGALAFMYNPILQTLLTGATTTMDTSVWDIQSRTGSLEDRDAQATLDGLVCGDVLIWIGIRELEAMTRLNRRAAVGGRAAARKADAKSSMSLLAQDLPTHGLRARGVITIYYQTEPLEIEHNPARAIKGASSLMVWSTTFCEKDTSPFDEFWDYSHANVKRMFSECPEGQERPTTRFVPPGTIPLMVYERDKIVKECGTSDVYFLGDVRSHEDRLGYLQEMLNEATRIGSPFNVSSTDGIWGYADLVRFVRGACIQLSMHKSNAPGLPFESLRAATLLSGGSLLLSQSSDPDDMEAYKDIVHFSDSPQELAATAAQLRQLSPEDRQAAALNRAQLFDERFSPQAIFEQAQLSELFTNERPATCEPAARARKVADEQLHEGAGAQAAADGECDPSCDGYSADWLTRKCGWTSCTGCPQCRGQQQQQQAKPAKPAPAKGAADAQASLPLEHWTADGGR